MRLSSNFTRNLNQRQVSNFFWGAKAAATIEDAQSLLRDAHTYRTGWLGKAGSVGSLLMGLGTVPMVAGMFMPDANTRALEKMRNEDKLREAKGMRPLTQTGQLLKDKMSQATNAIQGKQAPVANTVDAVRTINPAPNFILPKALPPGSMAGGAMNLF